MEFLSLKGSCTGSSEYIQLKMPHCRGSDDIVAFRHKGNKSWQYRHRETNLSDSSTNKIVQLFNASTSGMKDMDIEVELCNGVARTLKKLRTSKGDHWIKQLFSSTASLFKIGTSRKGKNSLPEQILSFKSRFL